MKGFHLNLNHHQDTQGSLCQRRTRVGGSSAGDVLESPAPGRLRPELPWLERAEGAGGEGAGRRRPPAGSAASIQGDRPTGAVHAPGLGGGREEEKRNYNTVTRSWTATGCYRLSHQCVASQAQASIQYAEVRAVCIFWAPYHLTNVDLSSV